MGSGSNGIKASGDTGRLMGTAPSTGSVTNQIGGSTGSSQGKAADLGWIGRLTWLPADVRVALHASITNRYVWYLGMVKITRDIAGKNCTVCVGTAWSGALCTEIVR